MNFDLVHAWRNSGLFQRFQAGAPGSYLNVTSRATGIGALGMDTAGGQKPSSFGSAYQLSLSPGAKHWNLRNHAAGISEDEKKRLLELALQEEEIRAAQKNKSADSALADASQTEKSAKLTAYSAELRTSKRKKAASSQASSASETPVEAISNSNDESETNETGEMDDDADDAESDPSIDLGDGEDGEADAQIAENALEDPNSDEGDAEIP